MLNQVRSNISVIATSVLPEDSHGIPQMVWYQGGVGTGIGLWDRLFGAATGEDVKRNVRDAYMFLVDNWIDGAEIYLFGWSRGAYTARIVSGLISEVGLLRKTGIEYFGPMFDAFFDPTRPTRDAVPESQFHKVSVECVGLWETVGSLGIPDSQVLGIKVPLLDRFLEWWNNLEWYRFEHCALPATSKIGLQAYSPHDYFSLIDRFGIDEYLRFLSPTLWYTSQSSANILKQVWFAGIHCSIAGGYAPHAFGDISLLWMISEVATLTNLEFDIDFIIQRLTENKAQATIWGAIPEPPYPLLADWLAYHFGPRLKRTPGKYPHPDGSVTNEFYHHSVEERIAASKGGYPAGKTVVKQLSKLPFTKMEAELAIKSGMATPAQIQTYWEIEISKKFVDS